jgi:hypothetical protein
MKKRVKKIKGEELAFLFLMFCFLWQKDAVRLSIVTANLDSFPIFNSTTAEVGKGGRLLKWVPGILEEGKHLWGFLKEETGIKGK